MKTKDTKNNLVEKPNRIYGERKNFGEEVLSKELGEKYVEYRKKWIKASKRKIVTDFPLYVQIEHVGRCNLRCSTCINGTDVLRENYTKGITKPLNIKLYKKILNEAKKYNCPSIAFHNNDEPLLLKDLAERIRMAKDAGFLDIIITTNANLLTPERTRQLLGSGITKLSFSLDSWNKEDYEKIRKGGKFDIVLKNIEYFLKEKKRMNLKLPITRATCVLTKFTYKDMEKFRNFWQKRVDIVEFQNLQVLKGHTENLLPPGAKIDNTFICNNPWEQVVIRPNGDVLPCCSFYGGGLILGNIKNSSIYEIWHGQKMKKIRKELLRNNFAFSPICKMCSETFYTL